MTELVQAPGELDAGKLAAYTTSTAPGSTSWRQPLLPEQADLVTDAKVLRLVEVAREAYDLVVIDTSPFFYGPMLALLGPTDHLLLLCGLDVPTLKNVRLSLRTLDLLGFPSERTNLVPTASHRVLGSPPTTCGRHSASRWRTRSRTIRWWHRRSTAGWCRALSESDSEFGAGASRRSQTPSSRLWPRRLFLTRHTRGRRLCFVASFRAARSKGGSDEP